MPAEYGVKIVKRRPHSSGDVRGLRLGAHDIKAVWLNDTIVVFTITVCEE
jgi:hypothetical protein